MSLQMQRQLDLVHELGPISFPSAVLHSFLAKLAIVRLVCGMWKLDPPSFATLRCSHHEGTLELPHHRHGVRRPKYILIVGKKPDSLVRLQPSHLSNGGSVAGSLAYNETYGSVESTA